MTEKLDSWFSQMPVIAILRGVRPTEVLDIGEALYQAEPDADASAEDAAAGVDEDIVDAEVVEDDEDDQAKDSDKDSSDKTSGKKKKK